MWIVSLRGSGAAGREESMVSKVNGAQMGTCLEGANLPPFSHRDVFF